MATSTSPLSLVPTAYVTHMSGVLKDLERDLNSVLLERADQVRLMLTCLVAKHHMVQIGPAGSAKSLLTRELVRRIVAGPSGEEPTHFLASMHPLLKEEELYGAVDFIALRDHGTYRFKVDGMLPTSHVSTLDEVFNSSGAILKTTMRLLNEREFKNGPDLIKSPLMACFGTSNQIPSDPSLAALWDRFLGRVESGRLSEAGRAHYQAGRATRRAALAGTPPATITLDDVKQLQALVPTVAIGPDMDALLLKIWRTLDEQGIDLSERRMAWCEDLLCAHALIEGRTEVSEDDLPILEHCLWSRLEERDAIRRLLSTCISPVIAQLRDIADTLNGVYLKWKQDVAEAKAAHQAAQEATANLTHCGRFQALYPDAARLQNEAKGAGRGVAQVTRIMDKIQAQYSEISKAVNALPF